MSFVDVFGEPTARHGSTARVARYGGHQLEAGVYADGVLVLLGDDFVTSCFRSWPRAFRVRGLDPIAYTGLGDLFLVEPTTFAVYLLEVQRQGLTRAASDVAMLLDHILVRPRIVEEVLRRPRIEELVRFHGALDYGQCFIRLPWAMLGGDDLIERHDKGDIGVYVNLVGQTAFEPEE